MLVIEIMLIIIPASSQEKQIVVLEETNSQIIQSEVGLLEKKKRASHITDEHRRAGQFRISWDTFLFAKREL